MERERIDTGFVKVLLAWAIVFLVRLIPFRPPNVEPMMAALMPISKRFGVAASFCFGFLGIALYDAVTSGWGVWTIVTALAYGIVGVASRLYFRSRKARVGNFVGFGVVATLFYDAATGLTVGPLLWHQSFAAALAGQIPFTLLHLLGTIVFAVVLSPAIYRWIVRNDSLEVPALARVLRRA